MRILRAVAIAATTAIVAGCIAGPEPAKDGARSAYAWRVPLTTDGDERVYRFKLPPDLTDWMRAQQMGSIAVFDAAGAPMTCGTLDAMSVALSWTETTFEGGVGTFDAAMCKTGGDVPPACLVGAECGVAPGCPHATIDLGRALPDGVSTLRDLLAVANGPDCEATPDSASCGSALAKHSDLSRRDARSAIARAGLGRLLSREATPTARVGTHSGAMGGALLSSAAKYPGIVQTNVGAPPPRHLSARTRSSGVPADGGYVVEFDEPVVGVDIDWQTDVGTGVSGRTTTIAYDAGGRPRTETRPLPQDVAGHFRQHVPVGVPSRVVRIVVDGTTPGLALVRASWTRRTPKPYSDGRGWLFWFKADGTAPYAIYLAQHRGRCGGSGNAREWLALPRIHDADFPPAAGVGAREVNPRTPIERIRADDPLLLTWLYWLAAMLVAWLASLAVVGVRWQLLHRRARRHASP